MAAARAEGWQRIWAAVLPTAGAGSEGGCGGGTLGCGGRERPARGKPGGLGLSWGRAACLLSAASFVGGGKVAGARWSTLPSTILTE